MVAGAKGGRGCKVGGLEKERWFSNFVHGIISTSNNAAMN